MKNIELPPDPSLLESMREMGYTTEAAIADLIDNSITALAENINIRFSWNNSDPWIALIDDGIGMNMKELVKAMTLGSINPLNKRHKDDLGRFGLGLKTASLSQTRSFIVISKKNKTHSIAQWDLDSRKLKNESKWSINVLDLNELESQSKKLYDDYLKSTKSGTIVYWNNIDRIDVGNIQNKKEIKFDTVLNNVKNHLELVFHRYLKPDTVSKRKINILFNKGPLNAYNPFFIEKSKELHKEEIQYKDSKISIQPYVLPHHNKVSEEEWIKYAGKRGYLHEQGFYIYRNKRLIIYANWFKLIPKTELTKLLRVKIDIPNNFDKYWKINVKKSNAIPPEVIKDRLKEIISKIEFAGKRVYKHRGSRLISQIIDPAWNRIANDNKIFYEINKEHFYIKNYIKNLANKDKNKISEIFKILESSFPRDSYYHDISQEPEKTISKNISYDDIKRCLDLYAVNGKIDKEQKKKILLIDPFNKHLELTEKIIDKEYSCE